MEAEILFAKVRQGAMIPSKRDEDAGYDVYACLDYNTTIVIEPHKTVMIPTGIASACSPDYCFILKERGSTGTKGIAQRCGVIDSGFRGEWFVPLTNTTDNPIGIANTKKKLSSDVNWYPYSKAICQVLVVPVPVVNVKEIPYKELQQLTSARGVGCVGSSNK